MQKVGKLKRLYWYLLLIPKLGLFNIVYVQFYRQLIKFNSYQRKFPIRAFREGTFFSGGPVRNDYPEDWKAELIKQADTILEGRLPYYSFHHVKQSSPPNWFLNPFNQKECSNVIDHWMNIGDFDEELGDIKNIWEISRFAWAGVLARAYKVSGNPAYLKTLNQYFENWAARNPVNQGPNWKCGQESALRMLRVLDVLLILGEDKKPSQVVIDFIKGHLDRVSSNLRYALAQRNNHATSEAAALFIGGIWLKSVDPANKKKYHRFERIGRGNLLFAVRRLIYPDGAFAQHSVNYHRLFLDTLSQVVFWTKHLEYNLKAKEFYNIYNSAKEWLLDITDESGRSPNIGSNDGSLLQTNHACDYNDNRPSLQLASMLIDGRKRFDHGPWDEVLYWYLMDGEANNQPLKQRKFSKVKASGYVIMNNADSWALLHYPNYKFRPAHNDVFHFDLWSNGTNLLMDSGTYSYNPDKEDNFDFKSVHAHNTISFDKHEQMPRLSRFLLAKWVKPRYVGKIENSSGDKSSWYGTYKDHNGNIHKRQVEWTESTWIIKDFCSGRSVGFTSGYNFDKCEYSLDESNHTLTLQWGTIEIIGADSLKIVEQFISLYYMDRKEVNRLVISSKNNAELITKIHISQ